MSSVPLASETTAPAAPEDPDAGPRIYGVVDVVRSDRIAGWAIDRGDSRASLDVDIRREGRVVATVRADRLRKDLERNGVGTGRYGFACSLEPPLEPGFEFAVSATARTPDGVTAELGRFGGAAAATDPERRLLERIFEEVSQIRSERAHEKPPEEQLTAESLAELIRRLEVVQARVEAALGGIEAPKPRPLTGLRVLVGVSLAVGIGSLALGLWSMWQA